MLLNRLVSYGLRLLGVGGSTTSTDQAVALRSKLRMAHNFLDTLVDGTCYGHDITSSGLAYDAVDYVVDRSVVSRNFDDIDNGTNLATNSGFDTDLSGWTVAAVDNGNGTPDGTVVSDSGECLFTQGSIVGGLQIFKQLTTVVGRTYKIQCNVISSSRGWQQPDAGLVLRARKGAPNTSPSGEIYEPPGTYNAGIEPSGAGTIGYEFVATTTTTWFCFEFYSADGDNVGDTVRIDDFVCVEAAVNGAKGTISIADNRLSWAGDCTFVTWFKVDGPADADRVAYLIRKASEMAVKIEDGGDGALYVRAYNGTETPGQHVESPGLSYGTWYCLWLVKSGLNLTLQINNWTEITEAIAAIDETANPVYVAETLNQNGTETVLRMESMYFWRRALSLAERQAVWGSGVFLQFPFENTLHVGHIGNYDEDSWANQHGSLANATGHIDNVGDQPLPAIVTDPTGFWTAGRKVFSADAGYGTRACVTMPQTAGQPWEINFWTFVTMIDAQSYNGEDYNPIVCGAFVIWFETQIGSGNKVIAVATTDSVTNSIVTLDAIPYLSKWCNFSAAYDGSTLRMYLNKRQIASWSIGANNTPPGLVKMCYGKPNYAGTALYATQYNFWNRVLSAQDREDVFNTKALLPWPMNSAAGWCTVESDVAGNSLESGLIHFWKMDAASGNEPDTVAGNTMVASGFPASVTGVIGNARRTNNGEWFETESNVKEMAAFSIGGMFRLYPTVNSKGKTFIALGPTNGVSFGLRINFPVQESNHAFFQFGSISYDYGAAYQNFLSAVVTSSEADGAKLYVAGVLVAQAAHVGTVAAGKWMALQNDVPGDQQEEIYGDLLAIWDRVLTADEAASFDNAGGGWEPSSVFDVWSDSGSAKTIPAMTGFFNFESALADVYGTGDMAATAGSGTVAYSGTAKFGSAALYLNGAFAVRRLLSGTVYECRSAAAWVRWNPAAGAGERFVDVVRYVKDGTANSIRIRFFKNNTKQVIQFIENSTGTTTSIEKPVQADTWYFVGYSIGYDNRITWRFENDCRTTSRADHDLFPALEIGAGDMAQHDGVSAAFVDGLVFGHLQWTPTDFNHLFDDLVPGASPAQQWNTAASGETGASELAAKMVGAFHCSGVGDSAGVVSLTNTNTITLDSSIKKLGSHSIKNTGLYQLYRENPDRPRSVAGWIRFNADAVSNNPTSWGFFRIGGAYPGKSAAAAVRIYRVDGGDHFIDFTAYRSQYDYLTVQKTGIAKDTFYFVAIVQMDDGRLKFRIDDQEWITAEAYGLAHWESSKLELFSSIAWSPTLWMDEVAVSDQELTTADLNRLYNAGAGREYPYT